MVNKYYWKILEMQWKKPDYDFEHFKAVVSGYVENKILEKPTEKEIRDAWKDLTGEDVKQLKKKIDE
jgi:hypothetical protein